MGLLGGVVCAAPHSTALKNEGESLLCCGWTTTGEIHVQNLFLPRCSLGSPQTIHCLSASPNSQEKWEREPCTLSALKQGQDKNVESTLFSLQVPPQQGPCVQEQGPDFRSFLFCWVYLPKDIYTLGELTTKWQMRFNENQGRVSDVTSRGLAKDISHQLVTALPLSHCALNSWPERATMSYCYFAIPREKCIRLTRNLTL